MSSSSLPTSRDPSGGRMCTGQESTSPSPIRSRALFPALKENNWGYFVEQKDMEKTSTPVYLAGEETSIHGVWARRLTGPMRLALHAKFALSLKQASAVRVIWLNEPDTAWRATVGIRNLPSVKSDGSGRWRETRLEIPSGTFAQNPVLKIEPLKGQPAFHLVEIRREGK